MLDLESILNLLGDQNDNRNGVVNQGVYTPPNTRFDLYNADPNTSNLGYVKPIQPNTANINIQNDDDVNTLYTLFHEAAHTAQMNNDLFNSIFGDSKLRNNNFDYYGSGGKVPTTEALATLRGMEAMMPPGSTIWNYPDRNSVKGADQYLQETLRNNPGMTPEGAKRYIDLRMFPEHQLMENPGNEKLSPFDDGLLAHIIHHLLK